MRIISGLARGARLFVPLGTEIRPLTDLMRGAIFSRLGPAVAGARVLDLFAGTGAFGLEALSRGAERVTLVDRSRMAIDAIKRNTEKVVRDETMRAAIEVAGADVFVFIDRAAAAKREFDIIFAGPPYAKLPGQTSLARRLVQLSGLPGILAPGGSLIVEHFKKEELAIGSPWKLARTLHHGGTLVEFLGK